MSERYGYVNFYTPYQGAAAATVGRWRFRLDETVTDFKTAWEAAVAEFATDVAVWRDARRAGHVFSYGDLVRYPQLLARHGLILVPDPPGHEATVDHDDILVDPYEDAGRCLHEDDGGVVCGVWLGDRAGGPDDRCSAHDA